ncbi:MAG: TolC family protein [Gammaproteobacteria bacterium]
MTTGIYTKRLHAYSLFLLTTLLCSPGFALTLQQAEQTALQNDPMVASMMATSRAQENESVAASTLPDPQLRLGMFNVPLDTYSVTQEPMTQMALGLQQQFPRGDVLDIKAEQTLLKSQASRALANNAQREVIRDLRVAFLNLYYEIQSGDIIRESRALFSKLVKITEDQYAAGRANQQDVIRADLELSRLDDRYTKILSRQDQFRAELGQWLGDSAWQPLDTEFPVLPDLPALDDVNTLLTQHPLIHAQNAELNAAHKMTAMAQQDYKPGFNAFIEYRKRFGDNPDGSDRSDMMAAMVTMDIPLFTENRQDKSVAASEENARAARYKLDDKLRMLKQMFDKSKSMYQRSAERQALYKSSLLASAINNTSASLNAYQSGVTEFTTLMRAQITELDVRLDDLRVRIDKAIAQAQLLYVTGEAS